MGGMCGTYNIEPGDAVRNAMRNSGMGGRGLTILCTAHSIELSIQLEPLVAGDRLGLQNLPC
jgi:hypothetical protein